MTISEFNHQIRDITDKLDSLGLEELAEQLWDLARKLTEKGLDSNAMAAFYLTATRK